MTVAKEAKKDWAREFYQGVENSIKPSYTTDFQSLDVEGIALDVEHSIKHGFFATFCASPSATPAEYEQFLNVAVQASAGRLLVSMSALAPSLDQSIDLLQRGERAGCSHALVGYPRKLTPSSERDVEAYFRALADSTSMGLVLYATPHAGIREFEPSGIPIRVFERLATVSNIIAMKLTQTINPAASYELCERLSDKLQVGPADLDSIPLLASKYNIQCVNRR